MLKHKLLQNRLVVYLFCLYLIGLLFGIFLINPNYNYNSSEKNFSTIFFSNYWYIFLIWIFGFSIIGFVSTTLIVFFRGFLFGALVRILVINNFKTFVLMLFLEVLFIIPVLIITAYISLNLSKENLKIILKTYSNNISINKYINLMLVVTVVIVVYSLIIYLN